MIDGKEEGMLKIVKDERGLGLRYRFWLTDGSDQEDKANIQDQIIAIIWGWA